MTPDTFAILLCIGMPVFLGIFLTIFLTIGKRANAFPCPVCKRLIPVEAIQEAEVVCNHCDWGLVSGEDSLRDRKATDNGS